MRKALMLLFMGAAGLTLFSSTVFARADFDTPQATYGTWISRMAQYEGKTEFIKMCYSERLRAQITERTKDPGGVRRMDGNHFYLNREIGKYNMGPVEEVSDTKVIMKLEPKDGSKAVDLPMVLEDDGWKIDEFPDIGSEAGLSGRMLAILAVILFVIIIVVAKKFLLP